MHPAYKGEMAEWLKAPLSKSGNSRNWVRGFESHSLRFSKLTAASCQLAAEKCDTEKRRSFSMQMWKL